MVHTGGQAIWGRHHECVAAHGGVGKVRQELFFSCLRYTDNSGRGWWNKIGSFCAKQNLACRWITLLPAVAWSSNNAKFFITQQNQRFAATALVNCTGND